MSTCSLHALVFFFKSVITLIRPSKFRVNRPFGSGEQVQVLFELAAVATMLEFRSEQFSLFLSARYLNISCQGLGQFAFPFRRS